MQYCKGVMALTLGDIRKSHRLGSGQIRSIWACRRNEFKANFLESSLDCKGNGGGKMYFQNCKVLLRQTYNMDWASTPGYASCLDYHTRKKNIGSIPWESLPNLYCFFVVYNHCIPLSSLPPKIYIPYGYPWIEWEWRGKYSFNVSSSRTTLVYLTHELGRSWGPNREEGGAALQCCTSPTKKVA